MSAPAFVSDGQGNFSASNAASARAIADDANLSITEDGRAAAFALGVTRPAEAPATKSAAARGYSDIVAHVAFHHNAKVHKRLQPAEPLCAKLFNEFERARCEALGSARLSGSAANLAALWSTQAARQITSSRSTTERQLLYVVAMVREQLGLAGNSLRTGADDTEFMQPDQQALEKLAALIDNQEAFALAAKLIIQEIEFAAADTNESSAAAQPQSEADDAPQDTQQDTDATEDTEQDADDSLSVTLRETDPKATSGSTSASSTLPPFDLTRFELHEELGRGAYGVVFRATQTDLEREVALKVLRPREGELSA
ncbi:MAG: hypothetical protein AAF404_00870, partial [Pseudomonadota bacterium]